MIAEVHEGPTMKRIRLKENFAHVVARHGIGMNEIADLAGVHRATIYALQSPETHPNRVGGMHRTTAWKLVNAFANKTGIDPDAAWDMLMIEVDEPRRQRKQADTDTSEGDTSTKEIDR